VDPRPICLDPVRDSVFIRHDSVMSFRAAGLHCWLNYLNYHYPEAMRAIKELQLRDFTWTEKRQMALRLDKTKRQITDMYLGPLLRLPGLEKLYLSVILEDVVDWLMSKDMEESIAAVQEFFDRHEERFGQGKAPTVVPRLWIALGL